jgi:Methyltransferase domain
MSSRPTDTGNKLKLLTHKYFRAFGFDIVRTNPVGPIMGSFPPHAEYFSVGRPENYFIHDGYGHRAEAIYYDDANNTNQWQMEVYKFAREVLDRGKLRYVCDIGCGSAYKLLKYFEDCNTVGLDVPKTCEWLRAKYFGREWVELDFSNVPALQADLVIAADVVEHLLNPDELMDYVSVLSPKFVVFSTPDRNLLRNGAHNGPPGNPAHIREWSFAEFGAYVASRFQVLDHFISNSRQSTQCVLCAPRQSAEKQG